MLVFIGTSTLFLSPSHENGQVWLYSAIFSYQFMPFLTGSFHQVVRPNGNIAIRNTPPRFPMNIYGSRTNNICESWNNQFSKLVGHHNPNIWACIDALKKDNILVHLALDRHVQGIRHTKRITNKTRDLRQRLKRLCEDQLNGVRPVLSLLQAVGHTIRFH